MTEYLDRIALVIFYQIKYFFENVFLFALLHNSEIRFLMIGLCFHITNFESIFHRLELNVAYNYEKIELCNKAFLFNLIFVCDNLIKDQYLILKFVIYTNHLCASIFLIILYSKIEYMVRMTFYLLNL